MKEAGTATGINRIRLEFKGHGDADSLTETGRY